MGGKYCASATGHPGSLAMVDHVKQLPREAESLAQLRKPKYRKVYLAGRWYTVMGGLLVGVVAVINIIGNDITKNHVDWAAYIGIGTGVNAETDERIIAETGAKLQALDASTFFPFLPLEKYRQ